jgi:hypothetical protein
MTEAPHHKLRRTRKYRTWRAMMLRRLGDVCHVCGHAGAADLDHLTPLSVDPSRLMDPSNVMPAHGVDGCHVCPPVSRNGRRRTCNQERGDLRQKEEKTPPQSQSDLEREYGIDTSRGEYIRRERDGLVISREW